MAGDLALRWTFLGTLPISRCSFHTVAAHRDWMHSVVGFYNTCNAGVDLVLKMKCPDRQSSNQKWINSDYWLFFTLLTKVGTNQLSSPMFDCSQWHLGDVDEILTWISGPNLFLVNLNCLSCDELWTMPLSNGLHIWLHCPRITAHLGLVHAATCVILYPVNI